MLHDGYILRHGREKKVFMDDFSVLRRSFDNFLENLRHTLIRSEETNIVLN